VRWSEKKSRRFQDLREVEAQGSLTDSERAELNQLLNDLDADEADDLRSTMEQAQARAKDLAAEKEQLEAQAAALARIVAEQEGLLTDATTYLQRLRDRSAALAEDYRRLMGHEPISAR
jgi:DNA repair exonuclease SbcCD ATPase subunit